MNTSIVKKVSVALSVVVVVVALLYFAVQASTASMVGQPLGERTIVGYVISARVAPATFPESKLGVTMDDGTYLILEHDTIVDTRTLYRVRVRETRQSWGIYSYVLSFTETDDVDMPSKGAK